MRRTRRPEGRTIHGVEQENHVAEKPAKPMRRRASSPNTAAKRKRQVEHDEIARRAYFIYLDEGGADELGNWLRAERELAAA